MPHNKFAFFFCVWIFHMTFEWERENIQMIAYSKFRLSYKWKITITKWIENNLKGSYKHDEITIIRIFRWISFRIGMMICQVSWGWWQWRASDRISLPGAAPATIINHRFQSSSSSTSSSSSSSQSRTLNNQSQSEIHQPSVINIQNPDPNRQIQRREVREKLWAKEQERAGGSNMH